MMRWISSTGGPLVLLPTSLQATWRGALGCDGEPSDYALACSVKGYTGIVPKQGQQLLILNDEPLQTTVVRSPSQLCLVRWVYAPSRDVAEELLHRLEPTTLGSPLETVEFQVDASSWILFDAGSPGWRIDEKEAFQLELTPGSYSVRVYDFAPTRNAKFLILSFEET